VDEATDVVEDAHSITSVRYVLENDKKEAFLFFIPIDDRVFSIRNRFLEENETVGGLHWDLK
jgi:hypothetical protein